MTATYATPDWGWTADEIAAWNKSADCTHAAFDALDTPQRPMEACPDCGLVLRTITTAEGWGENWAEQRAEERAHEEQLRRAREEDARW